MSAPVHPETIGELIENLKLYPSDWKIDFSPFTLCQVKDRGGVVHFELNEVDGVDYEILNRANE